MIELRRTNSELIASSETKTLKQLVEENKANLVGADLVGAYLREANLEGAYLVGADLEGANLRGAYLEGAYLAEADLRGADLERAYLAEANLRGADLEGANLREATLNFGETWEEYLEEVVPELLIAGGKTLDEILDSGCWNCHSWDNCPMHEAFGIKCIDEAPKLLKPRIEEFVRFFDADLIPKPKLEK